MKKQKGFTLIELLVVVAIIGVMAAMVIANLASANKKSRDSRRKADLASFRTALELYYDDNTSYPDTLEELTPTYIKEIPSGPQGEDYEDAFDVEDDNLSYTITVELETSDDDYSVTSVN